MAKVKKQAPSKQHLGGHLPLAFTEHGVLMLAYLEQLIDPPQEPRAEIGFKKHRP